MIDQANAAPLSGLQLLVTRPAGQADKLIHLLQEQGAEVLHQPAISIISTPVDTVQQQLLDQIEQFDRLIFISKNAVDFGLEHLRLTRHWPDTPKVAAIGRATADALLQHGLNVDFIPDDGFDSEALLALDSFQTEMIKGCRILIFRGGAGRDHLKQELETRGARVDYLDVYLRIASPLTLSEAQLARIDAYLFSSLQGFDFFYSSLTVSEKSLLSNKTIIAPSLRCQQAIQQQGFKRVIAAANATDEAMLETVLQLRKNIAI